MDIKNQQDILQALDTDLDFRKAVRRHLLTEELLNLPEQFAAFVTEQREQNQRFNVFILDQKEHNAEQREPNRQFSDLIVELQEQNQQFKAFIAEQRELNQQFKAFIVEQRELNQQFKAFIVEQRELNQQFKAFIVEQREHNQKVDASLQRITTDIGNLKGDGTVRATWDYHPQIAEQLGFTDVTTLSANDLRLLSRRTDRVGIPLSELQSYYRADLVIEALDGQNQTHYIAVEASYTADERDTSRVARNVEFLTRFTGHPAHPVIASVRNDHHVQQLVDNRAVHWYQLVDQDLQPR